MNKQFIISLIDIQQTHLHKENSQAQPLHFFGLSIMCKTTICPKAFNASPPHELHQCHQIPLRYGVPLLLQKLEELNTVYCWRMLVINTAAQDVPEVLN